MSKWRKASGPAVALACLTLMAACSQYDVFGTRRNIVVDQPAGQSFVAMETLSGKVLATPGGMTLYTYDKDTAGTSTCYGECAEYWPPLLAGAGAHEADFLTLSTRTDGTKQWMASNKPLYTYIQDKKPGEVKGDNFHNVWHVVKVQQ